jgi:hypothetical protein
VKPIKVAEAPNLALNWAVAKALGREPTYDMNSHGAVWNGWWLSRGGEYVRMPDYCGDWAQGGPIIDRLMNESYMFFLENDKGYDHHCALSITEHDNYHGSGPTSLIAVMRAYVESNFGDTVEVPEELL